MNEYKVGNLVVFSDGSSGLITEESEKTQREKEFKIEWTDGETSIVYASLDVVFLDQAFDALLDRRDFNGELDFLEDFSDVVVYKNCFFMMCTL